MAFKWDVPPTEVFPQGYANYTQALFQTGNRVAEARAAEAEQWMKASAPWQDQTGRARAGLHVDVSQSEFILAQLTFAHGEDVEYGVWLEIANQGRFAIIAPAIDAWGSRLMQDVQRLMNLQLVTRGD